MTFSGNIQVTRKDIFLPFMSPLNGCLLCSIMDHPQECWIFPFDVCGSFYGNRWLFFDKSSIWALNINVLNEKVINDYLLENHTNVIAGDDLAKLIYDKATKDINSRFACKNSKDEYLFVTRPLLSNERINR